MFRIFVFFFSTLFLADHGYAQSAKYIIAEKESYLSEGELTQPDILRFGYPQSGVSLGSGWDLGRGRKTSSACIEFKREEAGGQIAKVETKRIENSDTLRREMDVSYKTSTSADYKAFSGSASAKLQFLEKSRVDEHTISVLVKASVVNGVEFVGPADAKESINSGLESSRSTRLSKFAKELLANEDIEAFRDYCGDGFVQSIVRGAELYAVYNWSNNSEDTVNEKLSSANIAASYMGFGGSLHYQSKSLSQIVKTRKVSNVEYYHSAHRGLTLPYNEPDIANSIAYLGAAASLNDSFPFRFTVQRYDTLPEFDDVANARGFFYNEQREALRMRLIGLAHYLDTVLKHPTDFGLDYLGLSLGDVEVIQENMLDYIEDLEKQSRVCFEESEQDGLNLKEAEQLFCVSKQSRRYSDWAYRAIMPLHKDLLREKTEGESSETDLLDKRLANLEVQLSNTVLEIRRWKVKCGKLGESRCRRSEEVKCDRLPSHATCQNLRGEILRTDASLRLAQAKVERDVYADSRYQYWIKQTSRDRRRNKEIGGYLSKAELAALQLDMLCQDPVVSADAETPCPLLGEPKQIHTLQDRIIRGERPTIDLQLNATYRDDRTALLHEAIKEDFRNAQKTKARREQIASAAAFKQVFGVSSAEELFKRILPDGLTPMPLPIDSPLPTFALGEIQPSKPDFLISAGRAKEFIDKLKLEDPTLAQNLKLTDSSKSGSKLAEIGPLIERFLSEDEIHIEAISDMQISKADYQESIAKEAMLSDILKGTSKSTNKFVNSKSRMLESPEIAYDEYRNLVLEIVGEQAAKAKTTRSIDQQSRWERTDALLDWELDFDVVFGDGR
ncbi:MAG: hypothetical protein ABJO27_19900 [Pseudoruegeria sp.]